MSNAGDRDDASARRPVARRSRADVAAELTAAATPGGMPSSKAETAFQKIFDAAPDDERRVFYLRVQKHLKWPDDDEAWLHLFALDYFRTRMRDDADRAQATIDTALSDKIAAIEATYKKLNTDVDEIVSSAREKAKLEAAATIAEAAQKDVTETAQRIFRQGARANETMHWARVVAICVLPLLAVSIATATAIWLYAADIRDSVFEQTTSALVDAYTDRVVNLNADVGTFEAFRAVDDRTIDELRADLESLKAFEESGVSVEMLDFVRSNPRHMTLWMELTETQRNSIEIIAQESLSWNRDQGAPWPCVRVDQRLGWSTGNRPASVCYVPYGNIAN